MLVHSGAAPLSSQQFALQNCEQYFGTLQRSLVKFSRPSMVSVFFPLPLYVLSDISENLKSLLCITLCFEYQQSVRGCNSFVCKDCIIQVHIAMTSLVPSTRAATTAYNTCYTTSLFRLQNEGTSHTSWCS